MIKNIEMETRLIRWWITSLCFLTVLSQASAYFRDESQSCTSHSNDTLRSLKRHPRSIESSTAKCVLPIEFFPSGRTAMGSVPRKHQLPPWMNLKLAQQGQRVGSKYFTPLGISHILGLLFILMIQDGNDVLLMTRNSDTPAQVKLRYIATIAQVKLWYEDEFVSKDQSSDTPVLLSLASVRGFHSAAAARAASLIAEKQPLFDESLYKDVKIDEDMWNAFEKDIQGSDLPDSAKDFAPEYYEFVKGDAKPVNQFLLAMTQYAFIGFPILFPDRIGMKQITDEEAWALNHLWAVLAYALGIEDKYNIALQPNLKAARVYYKKFFEKFYRPILFQINFTTKVLVEALLNGMRELLQGVSMKVQMYRLLNNICKIPGTNLRKTFTLDEEAQEQAYELQESAVYDPLNPFLAEGTNTVVFNFIDTMGREMYGAEKYDDKKTRATKVFIQTH